MKILCVSYEYPPIGGGGANVAHPLAATLATRGHQVDVVTSGMHDLPREEVRDGVAIHRVPCFRRHRHFTTSPELATWLWPAYRESLKLVNQRCFDVNHTHFALPSGLVSYALYKKTGLPYVITIHGSDVPGYNPDRFQLAHRLANPIWHRIIRNSARIISASHFLKKLLQLHIDVPVDIVRNGFDVASAAFAPRPKQNRILVVTRMFRRKGVQHFIEALRGIDHDWEVVIAGDGPYLPVTVSVVRHGAGLCAPRGRKEGGGTSGRRNCAKVGLGGKTWPN
jgi:glycosyltransferase involved in cell wall biosynthesis